MQTRNSCHDRRQRGASIVLFTMLTALVLIPVVALAIDGSVAFWCKAKLSAAVDAAALAAGRDPSSNATTLATQYLSANFPSGWMGTYSTSLTAAVDYPQSGMRRVTVSATTNVPLYFARIIGFQSLPVVASAASSRRSVNVMLVLDRSGSMNNARSDGSKPCDVMKSAAQNFVNYFIDGQDQLGLISFQAGASVDYPHNSSGTGLTPAFTTHFKTSTPSLSTTIGDIVCGANTSSAMALNMAYKQIQALGSAAQASNGVLNVIVFFTDGFPNGLTANYPPKDQVDNRYDPSNTGTLKTVPATSAQCMSALNTYRTNADPNGAGVIVQSAGGMKLTGTTNGPFQITVPPKQCTSGSGYYSAACNTSTTVISATGCNFASSSANMREDVAYIPQTDFYGNSTVHDWYGNAYMTNYPYESTINDWILSGPYSTGCTGGSNPNNCGLRVDSPESVDHAAFNAADYQASAIIHDTHGYDPVIYVIGLGGASDMPDPALLQRFCRRVANDPSSDIYDSSRPKGMMVWSPDTAQLQAAFQTVASQVLRLSR